MVSYYYYSVMNAAVPVIILHKLRFFYLPNKTDTNCIVKLPSTSLFYISLTLGILNQLTYIFNMYENIILIKHLFIKLDKLLIENKRI